MAKSGNKNWVDFKKIKETVSMEAVLKHYGIFDNMKKSGKNMISCCPIHNGSNSRQFSVNLEKNLWNCFGNCKTGGNVLDFVSHMETGSNDEENIRKAAIKLKEWFAIESESEEKLSSTKKTKPNLEKCNKSNQEKKDNESNEVKENKLLKFELQSLNQEHKWFQERGINRETIEFFGLGFCSKGMMKDRIAIPVHNEKGELIAYSGRAITDEQAKEDGKYKLPPNFYKSLVVYNLHRQEIEGKRLILVESYISVWWLYQAGISNVVALQGSKLCPEQKQLIVNYFKNSEGNVLLLFDHDADGEKCSHECLIELSKELFVRWVDIGRHGKKPHLIPIEVLQKLLL